MKQEEITLEIEGFTPATLPMSRLAQYLAEFSSMLGNEASVHFSRLVKGSARCKALVDDHAVPKVRERIEGVLSGDAPKPALKAHKILDDLLAEDNAIGGVYFGARKVIEFPGRRRAVKERFGPVKRSTTVEGQIFMIGGKDETINVHLRHKDRQFRCEVSIDLARKLAPYFLNGAVRLFGQGDWYRVDAKWEMASFIATDFVELEKKSLKESLADLRAVFASVPPEHLLSDMEDLRRG